MKWIGFLIVLVVVAGGCGAVMYRSQQASDDVTGVTRAYLGASYTVSGCSDAHYSQGGAELWKCAVSPGGPEFSTWDVLVRDGHVVDASPA